MGLPVASATFVRIEGTPCGNVLGAVCNIKKMLPVALSKLEKRLQEASKTGLFAKCHWDADWEIESGEHGLRFHKPSFRSIHSVWAQKELVAEHPLPSHVKYVRRTPSISFLRCCSNRREPRYQTS